MHVSENLWTIGENVPWSSAWTGEVDFTLKPSADFPGLMDLVQKEDPGAGDPLLAVMHVSRNRRAMFQNLCHVCGELTPEDDRWLFPLETGGMVPMGDGTERYGGNVPPVHRACASVGQLMCPHLRRNAAQPVAFPEYPGRMIYRTDVTPGLEPLARTLPKQTQVVFSCYRLHGPEFTELVQELEQRRDGAAEG
jgi:hypothetical protein